MGVVLAKALLWCALLAGVVGGAAVAVNALHVNGAVASLIVAFVAGLVLLRLSPPRRTPRIPTPRRPERSQSHGHPPCGAGTPASRSAIQSSIPGAPAIAAVRCSPPHTGT